MEVANAQYDYIVVGCGGIGSGALYWLSRRAGNKVLGLEQFSLGHDNGGSQDVSRIIRMSYPDPAYCHLLPHTYDAFAEVERESGMQLVYRCGGLTIGVEGTTGGDIIDQYSKTMSDFNIPFQKLNAEELKKMYPQFTPDPRTVAVFQADSGLVDAALANSCHVQLARSRGADVIDNCPVTRISAEPDGTAIVYTPKGRFRCRKVVVTAGAWINQVLGSVGVHIPVRVTQEQVTYFATPHIKKFTKENFPSFIYHDDRDNKRLCFYGLPIHVNSGSKIGIDVGGHEVTPDTRTYDPDPVREEIAVDFLKKNIPEFLGPKMYTKTCLYTMPPDRNFVIDSLASRGKPQIIVCQGAGHAFKFAGLLGKIMSELAVDGKTRYIISSFNLERPAITDPNFVPDLEMGNVKQDKVKSNL